MRKVLNKKFSSPSKLVGKVFQRQNSGNVDSRDAQMTQDQSSLLKEIESLRGQVDVLKAALNDLKVDTENKEVKLAKLAREKEKLSLNLAKTRRSNESLAQQLEEERSFYFKEKETYCQEMNECKKLRKELSSSSVAKNVPSSSDVSSQEEIAQLKKSLEHTLHTNYNLSIKFLRMKETKNHLGRHLSRAEEEHGRVVNDLKRKIENLTNELKEILNQKFDAPLSPSNKKYLQLVNQNSSLVYENLYLQMQVDQLNLKLRRNKIQRTKSETSSRGTSKTKRKKARSPKTSEDNKVIKIFEKEKRASVPTVTILDEKEVTLKQNHSERRLQLPVVNESRLEVFQVSELQSRSSVGELETNRKRSRSAPKIVQSGTFKGSTPSTKRD